MEAKRKHMGVFLWSILVDGQITVVPICLSCLAGAMPILRVLASETLSAEGILKPPVWFVPWVALGVTEFCVVDPPHSDSLG